MSLQVLAQEEEVLNKLIVEVNRRRLKECKDPHLFKNLRPVDYDRDVYLDMAGLTSDVFYECSRCKGIIGPTAYEWWERGGDDAVKGERSD